MSPECSTHACSTHAGTSALAPAAPASDSGSALPVPAAHSALAPEHGPCPALEAGPDAALSEDLLRRLSGAARLLSQGALRAVGAAPPGPPCLDAAAEGP